MEPIYGLVAIGLVNPEHVKRNADARRATRSMLGKGLGVGIYSAALKKEKLRDEHYRAMIASTTKLNTPGAEAVAPLPGVHALTDVTGFGLLGHLLEVCKGSKVHATLRWDAMPLLPGGDGAGARGLRDRRLQAQLGRLRRACRSQWLRRGRALRC